MPMRHGPGILRAFLNSAPKPSMEHAARPAFAAAAALVAVAAEKFLLFGFHVAEARNVNAVGAIAEGHFVFMAGHDAAGAGAHVVIHEVVAEFAAAVGEAVGKFRSRGIEQDARGLERGSAKKKMRALNSSAFFGLRVDDAHAGDAAGLRNRRSGCERRCKDES